MQGASAAPDVVEEKYLRLKEKEEYFCCLGLRERHNALFDVDGLLKSRKFAMMFAPECRPKSMKKQDGGQRWPMISNSRSSARRPMAS
jgi:hypothetical protein